MKYCFLFGLLFTFSFLGYFFGRTHGFSRGFKLGRRTAMHELRFSQDDFDHNDEKGGVD